MNGRFHLHTSLAIAVPFRGGALVAAAAPTLPERTLPEDPARLHTSVVKTPWGLLAGAGPGTLDRTRRRLLQSAAVTVRHLGQELGGLLPPDAGPVLLSFEPEDSTQVDPELRRELLDETTATSTWLGSPIGLYRLSGSEPVRLSWGALLPPAGMTAQEGRDGQLHLQWGLDRGEDFDDRLEAILATFTWFGDRLPALQRELDLGVHEHGHRYSVDRMAW